MENVNYEAFMAKVNSGELRVEKEVYQKNFDPINGSEESIKYVIYQDADGNMFFMRHYDYNMGGDEPYEFHIATVLDREDLDFEMQWLKQLAEEEHDENAAKAIIDMDEYSIREEMRYDYAQTHLGDIIEPWDFEPLLPTDPDAPVIDPIDEPAQAEPAQIVDPEYIIKQEPQQEEPMVLEQEDPKQEDPKAIEPLQEVEPKQEVIIDDPICCDPIWPIDPICPDDIDCEPMEDCYELFCDFCCDPEM
jgi:hypothetical protein